jgi:hypothetical protein
MMSPRERPLMKRRIDSLLLKTMANGCTAAEAASSLAKATELVAKYGFVHTEFRWPPEPSTVMAAPSPKDPTKASTGGRGKGIGVLARAMIIDHPDWKYAAIAKAVNQAIEGAATTEKSVRWYAHQMRKSGLDPQRQRRPRAD